MMADVIFQNIYFLKQKNDKTNKVKPDWLISLYKCFHCICLQPGYEITS